MRQTALVMLLFASFNTMALGQEGKLLQEVIEQMARVEGREVGQKIAAQEAINLERTIALQESEEVVNLLARRSPLAADEVTLLGRFERLPGTNQTLKAEFEALPLVERRAVVELGEGPSGFSASTLPMRL